MAELAYREPEPRTIAGATGDWEVVVGMEVHAQVASKAKLFSGASTAFGAAPNSNVSLVDAAMPGMLPVINGFCVEQAVRTGLGLKAAINPYSRFDRKNYFYPDLPQGYQISQLYHPIVGEGEVIVDLGPGVARKVRIERIHLEQDAGKSVHDMDPDLSYVDLNRTGVALMEIVSRPDIRGAEEAAEYLRKLRQILRYLGTCDGNMQEGSLRADVNVSVRPAGSAELGTRCEIKNMNSMRFIVQAVEFEAKRQIALLEDGGAVEQETRLYDPGRGETRSMRSKEEAHDYRYFPDPDLLPLELDAAWIDGIAASLPELPDAKKARFVTDYGLPEYDAGVLTAETASADYFEAVAAGRDGKQAANWVINELFGRLNKEGRGIDASPVSAAQLGGIDRPRGVGRDLGQDRQGRVRDRLGRGRRSGRDRRGPRHAPGDRHRRDRGGGRRGDRREPGQGGAGAGQAVDGRLVRRPGDEGDRRQGESAGGQRSGEDEARGRVSGRVAMTHYDYRVIPAPKKVKRVKGVHGAEELFAATLTDAINEVARQGWEYVRAERLPAETPRGWLRGAGRRGAGGAGVPAPARTARAAARGGAGRGAGRGAAAGAGGAGAGAPGRAGGGQPAALALPAGRAVAELRGRRARTRTRRRRSDRPSGPDQRLPERSSASACTPPASSSASTRCTARLRSTRPRPSRAAARITTRKCVSPPSRQPPWPRWLSLSSMTSSCSGPNAARSLASMRSAVRDFVGHSRLP